MEGSEPGGTKMEDREFFGRTYHDRYISTYMAALWRLGDRGVQIEPAWHSAVCGVRPSKFSRGSPAGTGGSSVGATMVTTQGVY